MSIERTSLLTAYVLVKTELSIFDITKSDDLAQIDTTDMQINLDGYILLIPNKQGLEGKPVCFELSDNHLIDLNYIDSDSMKNNFMAQYEKAVLELLQKFGLNNVQLCVGIINYES